MNSALGRAVLSGVISVFLQRREHLRPLTQAQIVVQAPEQGPVVAGVYIIFTRIHGLARPMPGFIPLTPPP